MSAKKHKTIKGQTEIRKLPKEKDWVLRKMLSTEEMGLSVLSPKGNGCIIKCPGLLMLQYIAKEDLPGGTKQGLFRPVHPYSIT